jgi:hypothetical protein
MFAGLLEKKSRKILNKEVTKLGGSVEEIETIDVAAQPGVAKLLWVSTFGGDSTVSRVHVSRLVFRDVPAIFVRSFAGAIMHPGEIHTTVRGSLPDAVVFERGGKWRGPAERLSSSAELAAAIKKFSWELRTHLVMNLSWAVQLRPLGDGTSHLAFSSGTYPGLFSVGYGVALYRRLLEILPSLLGAGPDPAADFLVPCYGDLALPRIREGLRS